MLKPSPLAPEEILQHLSSDAPVLVDVVSADGLITHVNPCFEATLGWTQREVTEHQTDVLAECFTSLAEQRRALAFIEAGRGEWAEFKLRTRAGRVINTAWIELPLSCGTVLGIGVLERERRMLELEAEAYLRRLFAPLAGTDSRLTLMSVEQRGEEVALLLLADGQRVRANVPVELVNLSARYGSADLIIRMVQRAALTGA